ncbi:hypothetical protein M3Y99_00824000 [Aphelenchoides fujianensis]|nr:hypothetical protein M3Y99_00824000 [Aphelenchoides fujianensis]
MSEGTSECRHEPNGNALCSFRLPTEADRDYQSRAYELNPQRAEGIFFKMFYFCKSKDGRDWADPIAELGVVVSEFAGWKNADYFRRIRFARGPHQRWKFRVPRRVLEDAQADCGPLRAEFAIELDDRERAHWPPKRGRQSNASGRSSPHSDRVSPVRPRRRRNSAGDRSTGSAASFAPSDPNGSTFLVHLQDIGKKEFNQPRQTFEDIDFIPRFFPPDRWGRTSNFEFFVFHFHERELVHLTIDWALKNSRNEMDFHERTEYTFHRCRCPPNSKCKHRKTYYRVRTDKLEEFADGRPVILVLKLRSDSRGAHSASPFARSEALEGSESPVPPAGFANPYIDYGMLDGSPQGVQPPLTSGGPVVELQPMDGPHFVPPPIPLSVQPKTNGVPVGAYVNAINEMLTRATGAGTSASAPPPAAAVSPAVPTIRVKEEPTDEETIEKEPLIPSAPTVKLTIPPPTTVRRPVVVKPIEVNRNTQESREKEIVPTPPPTDTPPLAADPKEIHPPNATETVRIKQEPQVDEQPQVEQPKESAALDVEEESDDSDDDDDESDDESSSEEEPEIEEVTPRKRRFDPPASSRSGRTPTKRPRQVEKEEKAEEILPNPKVLNKPQLTVVVEGKEFEVERDLLIEESAFFAKKVAKQESLVDCLPAEISGDTMAAVVYWMETKRVDDLDKKAHDLYVAAKLLGMPDLLKTCVESIKRTCKQRKATSGVVFAVQHEDADLLSAMGFVWKRAKRMRKVLKSKEFGQLLKQRPELIHKVLDAM